MLLAQLVSRQHRTTQMIIEYEYLKNISKYLLPQDSIRHTSVRTTLRSDLQMFVSVPTNNFLTVQDEYIDPFECVSEGVHLN